MRALLSRTVGGPETLTVDHVDDPSPAADEVVIDVEACGVNFPDALLIMDKYQVLPPRPFSPGSEVCGFVSATGASVTTLKVGERVIARCPWGGMAEKLKVSAERCLRVPTELPAVELATLQFTYATAFHALHDRAALREGERLLVLGAAGGIGIAAVELGKAFGAKVFAAASSKEKLDFAQERGADQAILYPAALDESGSKNFAAAIKSAAGPEGIDVVIDPVGGAYTEAALRAMGRNGRLLIVGFPAGIAKVPMNLPLLKSCAIVGVDWRSFNIHEPKRSANNSRRIIEMYEKGQIAPAVSQIFSLDQAAQAIRQISQRSALGKLAIDMSGSRCLLSR
ncbi:NADPH:quinone oxidoreductase [Bradyrhizobium sp. LTSP885]|nr:NADPH:quinone oxidoreductase [Bradyrhizobium sp. LTSP885]